MMDNLIGKKIGQYEIERVVGEGTSGVVYRARQGQRPFALKIIHPHLVKQPGFRHDLLEQADTLINMGHQSIAHVHAISEASGYLYVVSDWIAGETLGQLMQHRPGISLALIGNLAIQIAEALIFTHRQGAVHGGLHPNNILLKPVGGAAPWQPVLTDFRLTSLISGTPSATLRPYLAPEQLSRSRVDARSDIFALGIILYQLTTGQLPAAGQATPPHTLRPDMPPAFGNVILQAAAPTVRDRFRSMEELAAALRREAGQLPHTVANAASTTPAPAPAPVLAPEPTASKNALLITHPDEKPRQFPLGQKWLITIGQMDGNDLVLPAEGVSAKHARLERKEDARWVIVDMNSRRGTLLANSRLLPDVPQEWRPGQELQIGPYTLAWGDGRSLPTTEPIETYRPPEPAKPQPPPPSTPKLTLTLNQPQVVVQPGEPSPNLVLELQNGPDEVTSVRLKVVQIPAEWVALEAGTIYLLPRQRVRVPLVIQPPCHHSARAGQHSYQVRAESVNGRDTTVCQGQLTILPFSRFQVETQPPSLKHGRQGKVVVSNGGNTPQGYTIAAEDVAQSLQFELPQTQLQAAPGETQSLPIAAKAKRPFTLKTIVAPFELQVREGERAVAVNGRVIISPILIWPLILLGLLLLAAAFWGGRAYICSLPEVKLLANSRFNPEAQSTWFCGEYTVVPEPTIIPVVVAAVTPTPEEVREAEPTEEIVAIPAEATVVTETVPTNTPLPPTAVPAGPERLVIGQSVNGVAIEAYAFGSGTDAVIFVGGIHYGYATASTSLAEQMITHFQSNPEAVAAIPANIKLFIVPNMNPDSIPSPGTVEARMNANGVNLNSNWPCNWGTGSQPGSATLSEPESKAVYDFILEQNTMATVFWNTPVNVNNQRAVSPGRCTAEQTAVSANLMNTYADAIPGYNAQQADPNQRFSGDATDSIAELGIPSIFVLLDSATAADVTQHLPAIEAVLQAYSN